MSSPDRQKTQQETNRQKQDAVQSNLLPIAAAELPHGSTLRPKRRRSRYRSSRPCERQPGQIERRLINLIFAGRNRIIMILSGAAL